MAMHPHTLTHIHVYISGYAPHLYHIHIHTAPYPHIVFLCVPLMHMNPQACLHLSCSTSPTHTVAHTHTVTCILCKHTLSQHLLTEPASTCSAHLHTLVPCLVNNTPLCIYPACTCARTHPQYTHLASAHAEGSPMFPMAASGASMDWPYGVSEGR